VQHVLQDVGADVEAHAPHRFIGPNNATEKRRRCESFCRTSASLIVLAVIEVFGMGYFAASAAITTARRH
jgi:hypothetical protein